VAGGRWQWGNIMPTAAANFVYDGVHVFLTFPQCPLEREQLRDRLQETVGLGEYVVARERHDDGNYHLHVYWHFGRRRRFTRADAFDVDGYHPNIQRPRSAKHVITYCRKEDDAPLVSDGLGDIEDAKQNGWSSILEQCEGRDEFLRLAREKFPRDYVLSLERLLFFCEWKFGSQRTSYDGRNRNSFREPLPLTEWVSENLQVNPNGVSSATPTGSATICSTNL